MELAYIGAQKAGADLQIALERAGVAREVVATVQRRVDAARDPLMAGAKAQAVLAEAEINVENTRRISEGARARLASFWGGDVSFVVDAAAFAGRAPRRSQGIWQVPSLRSPTPKQSAPQRQ